MMNVRILVLGIAAMFLIGMMGTESYAHTTVHVGEYEIEAGWGIEPPIVGIRNDIVIKVLEPGGTPGTVKGVTNVFRDAGAAVGFGGASKPLDISSDPRPGYYFSPIIPTKTGSYSVSIQGKINGTPIDVKIPVEDVEPTAILDFPPTSGGGGDSVDVSAMKNAILSIQQDISDLKSGQTESDGGAAYDYAVFGMSIAVAAIVLAIVAMIKRR